MRFWLHCSPFRDWITFFVLKRVKKFFSDKEDLPLTFWHSPPPETFFLLFLFLSVLRFRCPLKWSFKARMEGRGKFRGVGVWGRLLLHFIRTLIRRLITRILCPYTLRLNPSLQLDRENRDAARGCRARFGLVYFTSLYSSWLQFRTVHFPLAAGYRCQLFGLLKSQKVFASFAVRHTSVISTSSVLSLFSCCRRGCCLGGGGAARTCRNITFECVLYCMLLLLSKSLQM